MKSVAGRELMEKLGKGEDLDGALEAVGLTLGKAMQVLGGGSAKQERRWRRELARLQGQLMAERALPLALAGLGELLKNEAAAVKLRSVLMVLAVTGLDRGPAVRVKKEAAERAEDPEPTAERKAFLEAVAKVMEEERLRKMRGA